MDKSSLQHKLKHIEKHIKITTSNRLILQNKNPKSLEILTHTLVNITFFKVCICKFINLSPSVKQPYLV